MNRKSITLVVMRFFICIISIVFFTSCEQEYVKKYYAGDIGRVDSLYISSYTEYFTYATIKEFSGDSTYTIYLRPYEDYFIGHKLIQIVDQGIDPNKTASYQNINKRIRSQGNER